MVYIKKSLKKILENKDYSSIQSDFPSERVFLFCFAV